MPAMPVVKIIDQMYWLDCTMPAPGVIEDVQKTGITNHVHVMPTRCTTQRSFNQSTKGNNWHSYAQVQK